MTDKCIGICYFTVALQSTDLDVWTPFEYCVVLFCDTKSKAEKTLYSHLLLICTGANALLHVLFKSKRGEHLNKSKKTCDESCCETQATSGES